MTFCTITFSIPFVVVGYPVPFSTHFTFIDFVCYTHLTIGGMVGQLALSRAFQTGPLVKATALMVTSMFFSALFGFIFLSETFTWITGIGAFVIISSVLIVVMQKSDAPKGYHIVATNDEISEIEMAPTSVAVDPE